MLIVTTAPAEGPISLREAKKHCRVEDEVTEDDDYIADLIRAAREYTEGVCGRTWVTTTYRLTLDSFPTWENRFDGALPLLRNPCWGIVLERGPFQSVTSIQYYDTAGALQTLSPTRYVLDLDGGRITPAQGFIWPYTQYGRSGAVQVTYTAGYGDASQVPARAKQAMKYLIGTWYGQRESIVTGAIAGKVPDTADNLLMSIWSGEY